MKPLKTLKLGVIAGVAVALCSLAAADAPAPGLHTYSGGFSLALKLCSELHESLPEKFGTQIDDQPIILEPNDAPILTPVTTTAENKVERQVCMSAGFIDLINHLAHAKAVDNLEHGFFDRYVENLSRFGGTNVMAPDIVDARFWTDDVINDQMSYFNQMLGLAMAINLSHQYLGHFTKYSAQLNGPTTHRVPINDLLTPDEWAATLRAGTLNALQCALSTDADRSLFEAVAKLPKRPAWLDYFVPPNTDLKKLAKQLARWEDDFFHDRFK
jgi:hypothetical protein